jgi:hypothetical protein
LLSILSEKTQIKKHPNLGVNENEDKVHH